MEQLEQEIIHTHLFEMINTNHLWLFITLTFRKELPLVLEHKFINQYLNNMNRRVFTRIYKKKELYLDGFGVREQKFIHSPSHYHLVINEHNNVFPDRKENIEQIHQKSLDKVVGFGCENDIQVVYHQEPLIHYILKDVRGMNDVYLINQEGIV